MPYSEFHEAWIQAEPEPSEARYWAGVIACLVLITLPIVLLVIAGATAGAAGGCGGG